MKDINNYEGIYQVTENGDVWSVRRNRFLKPYKNQLGYLRVLLSKKGKGKKYFVHRLVAEAFIPNPNNYPIINHKDENPINNNVDNLEWCTIRYNNCYNDGQIKRARFKRKKVYQYDLNGNLIKEWISVNDAGRNGYSYQKISMCCLGKRKTHKGFIWSYEKLGE